MNNTEIKGIIPLLQDIIWWVYGYRERADHGSNLKYYHENALIETINFLREYLKQQGEEEDE